VAVVGRKLTLFQTRSLYAEAELLLLVVHNFKAVIATGLKPGIAIRRSLHYAHCKFHTMPTSGWGVAIASALSFSPTVSGRCVVSCQ